MAWTDATLWAWIFFLGEWAIRLVTVVVVPFRRTPAAAKGWLLLIFFEPWVGLLLYVLIGRAKPPRWQREQLAKLPQAMAGVVGRLASHPNVFHPEVGPALSGAVALAENLGQSPILDRGKKGNKHHAVVDSHGIPLAARLSAANAPDVTRRGAVLDAVPAAHGRPGRPRRRGELYRGRAYDSDPHRERLRRRGIKPRLARRETGHGSGLGEVRWVVERFFSWPHRYGRLRVRTDQASEAHDALLQLACGLICLSFLEDLQKD